MRIVITALFVGAFLLSEAISAMAKESSDTNFWKPTSSVESSSDVQYYGSKNAQTVTHTNVSVDDTREDNTVELQEYTEFDTKTSVTVLGNMGSSSSSSKIYDSGALESKTGGPVEQKGVIETPYGASARFNTAGTKFIMPEYKKKDEEPKKEEEKKKPTGPRVLVS